MVEIRRGEGNLGRPGLCIRPPPPDKLGENEKWIDVVPQTSDWMSGTGHSQNRGSDSRLESLRSLFIWTPIAAKRSALSCNFYRAVRHNVDAGQPMRVLTGADPQQQLLRRLAPQPPHIGRVVQVLDGDHRRRLRQRQRQPAQLITLLCVGVNRIRSSIVRPV